MIAIPATPATCKHEGCTTRTSANYCLTHAPYGWVDSVSTLAAWQASQKK